MDAIQAAAELLGAVPAFVWIGLFLVVVLLIILAVITTKRRNREVAELDKLFAESGDKSFDQPLALKRRPRKKSENNIDQKVNEEKRENGEARLGEDEVQAEEEMDRT